MWEQFIHFQSWELNKGNLRICLCRDVFGYSPLEDAVLNGDPSIQVWRGKPISYTSRYDTNWIWHKQKVQELHWFKAKWAKCEIFARDWFETMAAVWIKQDQRLKCANLLQGRHIEIVIAWQGLSHYIWRQRRCRLYKNTYWKWGGLLYRRSKSSHGNNWWFKIESILSSSFKYVQAAHLAASNGMISVLDYLHKNVIF